MYKKFFHLKENPFNITSDPGFYFASSKHSEAFSHLLYGIKNRKGIIVISGEVGTGKTTLCRTLLANLDPNVKTAFILNPSFSDTQLLQIILRDLGVNPPSRTKMDLIDSLNDFLVNQSSQGNNVALIIDEAQNLGIKQLEQVRLLSNLETEKEKLLQIILVGQPELLDKLRLPTLRQLNQRISVRYHILPLSKEELKEYVEHRLKIAQVDATGTPQVSFQDEAIAAIYDITKGTPRTVNILCDRALLAAFVLENYTITKEIIYNCAREVVHT
jgi:general secretion pathway protein A